MRGDDGEAGFHFIPGSPIIDLYCIVCGDDEVTGFQFIGRIAASVA